MMPDESSDQLGFYQSVVDTIGLALNLPGCIWLLDEAREALKIVAAHGLPSDYVQEAVLRLDESSVAAEVIRTSETIVVRDICYDARWKYRPEAEKIGLSSAMVVPLRVRGTIVGVLDVYSHEMRDFNDLEKKLVEAFATQVAATQRLIGDIAELTKVSRSIGAELEPLNGQKLTEVLMGVAESARRVLGADLVDVYEYRAADDAYTLPPTTAGHLRGDRVVKDKVFEDDTIVQVVKSGQARYFPNAQAETLLTGPFTIDRPDRPAQRFVVREAILSSAAIPLKTAGEIVGVMFINFRTKQDFGLEQKNAIELYAGQAAFAISSTRIQERLQQRIEVLKALNKVGTRLNLAKDRSDILHGIVESACSVMKAEVATVHLFDPRSQEFYDLDQAAVYPPEARAGMDKPRGDGSGMRVIRTGRIICEGDDVGAGNAALPSTFVRQQGIQAYVGLRLSIIDRPLGVLYLGFRQKHKFSEEDLALYDMLASYASTAIFQSLLFRQREEVAEIARDITSTLDSGALLQKTLERSLALLNCEFGSISVFDPETKKLHFKYAVGKPQNQWVELGQGLIGSAAQTRETVLVSDVHSDSRYVEHVAATCSELDVPMLVGDRLVGVLNAESSRLDAFSEEDRRLAEALAAQAAVAFRTAELYEEGQARLQERIGDIEALQRILALVGTGSLDQVLAQIAEEAARLTPAKYTGLWLLDTRTQVLRFRAMNKVASCPYDHPLELPVEDSSINGHVASKGEVYYCQDTRNDPYYRLWYTDVQSELTVPLKQGNRVVGTLNLESPILGAFTDDHVRLAKSLAGVAAAAIHTARVLQSLDMVNEVGRELTRDVRLREDEMLALIHRKASELMDTDNMYIALYDAAIDEVRFGLAYVGGKQVDTATTAGWGPRRGGRGRTEAVIHSKTSILTLTREESDFWYQQPGHQDYIGQPFASWLGVPVMSESQVLGVIATYNPERDYVYSKDDQEILEILAGQLATALTNRRLYTRVERLKTALLDLGQKLASAVTLPEERIVELVFEQTQNLTGCHDGYVALYNEQVNEIAFRIAMMNGKRVETGVEGWASRPIDQKRLGRTEEIIVKGEPILHYTHQESLDWYAQSNHAEFQGKTAYSYLGVPMLLGEHVLGVIAIYDWEREHAYDEDDQAVLMAMGGQAAIALQNARLYREARGEAIAARQLATLGTVMAALQHRINNTLNLISPNVERLRRRVDVDDRTVAEILDIIDRNVRYTTEIIRRILEPLKNQEIQTVDVNAVLDEVVRDVCELRKGDSTRPSVSVTTELCPTIPMIQAPTGQLAEVFRNLVENAFSAMKTGGEFRVTTQLTDSQIEIRFKDSGSGIPQSIRERLFKQPVPSGTPGGGAGLGLWLSGLILQSLGGAINVEQSDTSGTTMKVELPLSRN